MKCPKCGASIEDERLDDFMKRLDESGKGNDSKYYRDLAKETEQIIVDWNIMLEEVRLMAFAKELVEAFMGKNIGAMVVTLRKIFKEKEEFTYPEWLMEEFYKKERGKR